MSQPRPHELAAAQPVTAGGRGWRRAFQPDWREFRPIAALACVPAIVGLQVLGVMLGEVVPALVASTGALAVGFGAFQPQFRHPNTPMIAVALGASFSAGVGTIANAWLPVEMACTMLWGTGLGLMNLVAPGPGWLALQGAVALVIAEAFPATPMAAAYRVVLVLAGAMLQFGVVVLVRSLVRRPLIATQPSASITVAAVLRQALDIVARRRAGLVYALTSGLALTMADLLAHALPMANSYWVPMTVVLVLRPDTWETSARTMTRLVGTLGDAVLLTLLMALLRPSPPVVIVLIGISAWCCFALQRVNYGLLSFGVTSYVVLLFALAGLPEPVVALHRTIATALGGVIALIAHFLCRRLGVWFGGRLGPGCE